MEQLGLKHWVYTFTILPTAVVTTFGPSVLHHGHMLKSNSSCERKTMNLSSVFSFLESLSLKENNYVEIIFEKIVYEHLRITEKEIK